MKCLIVVAHPLAQSLCRKLADTAAEALRARGHEVVIEDLYASGFAPALSATERQSYYQPPYAADDLAPQIERLRWAEALVLVFPTWWFGFPAVLKGWFDRVWAPGIAYDHAPDLGAIRPRLQGLKRTLAITTLGSAWWIDHLIFRQPVRRVLKTAILGPCAPQCRFEMLSLYQAESVAKTAVESFGARVEERLARWN